MNKVKKVIAIVTVVVGAVKTIVDVVEKLESDVKSISGSPNPVSATEPRE